MYGCKIFYQCLKYKNYEQWYEGEWNHYRQIHYMSQVKANLLTMATDT